MRRLRGKGDCWSKLEPIRDEMSRRFFEVEQSANGGGYYVRATLPDGTIDRIEGFTTEDEAERWIRTESRAWLYARFLF